MKSIELKTQPEKEIRKSARQELKSEILKMIRSKVDETHEKYSPRLIVDRIGEVAMKELYNDILNIND